MCEIYSEAIHPFIHFIFFIHGNPVGKGRFSGGREISGGRPMALSSKRPKCVAFTKLALAVHSPVFR